MTNVSLVSINAILVNIFVEVAFIRSDHLILQSGNTFMQQFCNVE